MWKKPAVKANVPVTGPALDSNQVDKEWDAIQGALSNKLTTMGVDNLSPAEINYITQKIHNQRRSNRLTLQLQAVAGGLPVTKELTHSRSPPTANLRPNSPTPEIKKPVKPLRKVTTEINLGSRTPVPQLVNNRSSPLRTGRPMSPTAHSAPSKGLDYPLSPKSPTSPADFEKQYLYYKERCTKLEQVAKWLRELQTKNQKLEAELLQYQKGGAVSEVEKKYVAELQKKTNEVKVLHVQMEEVKLDNEILREQLVEQNKLIERLENGLKLAMDQIDYLSAQQHPADIPESSLSVSTAPIIEEDDEINYEDLDETTLLQLLAQTRQALQEKRKSVSFDNFEDLEAY